jgi:hypothetical protein
MGQVMPKFYFISLSMDRVQDVREACDMFQANVCFMSDVASPHSSLVINAGSDIHGFIAFASDSAKEEKKLQSMLTKICSWKKFSPIDSHSFNYSLPKGFSLLSGSKN